MCCISVARLDCDLADEVEGYLGMSGGYSLVMGCTSACPNPLLRSGAFFEFLEPDSKSLL